MVVLVSSVHAIPFPRMLSRPFNRLCSPRIFVKAAPFLVLWIDACVPCGCDSAVAGSRFARTLDVRSSRRSLSCWILARGPVPDQVSVRRSEAAPVGVGFDGVVAPVRSRAGRLRSAALLHDSTAARVGALFQLLVQDTTAQDFGLPSSAIRLRM